MEEDLGGRVAHLEAQVRALQSVVGLLMEATHQASDVLGDRLRKLQGEPALLDPLSPEVWARQEEIALLAAAWPDRPA
jgi:hypothetical protein